MRLARELAVRLRQLFRRRREDADTEMELRFHPEMEAELDDAQGRRHERCSANRDEQQEHAGPDHCIGGQDARGDPCGDTVDNEGQDGAAAEADGDHPSARCLRNWPAPVHPRPVGVCYPRVA